MPQARRKNGGKSGGGAAGAGGKGGCNTDADKAMADTVAELDDLNAALDGDGDGQASPASPPHGLSEILSYCSSFQRLKQTSDSSLSRRRFSASIMLDIISDIIQQRL
jgi:hypothetical protein